MRTLKLRTFLLLSGLAGGIVAGAYAHDTGINGPVRPVVTSSAPTAPTSTHTPRLGWQTFTVDGLTLRLSRVKNYPWTATEVNEHVVTIENGCPPKGCVTITLYDYQLTPEKFMADNHDCATQAYETTADHVGPEPARLYVGKQCLDGGQSSERTWVTGNRVIAVSFLDRAAYTGSKVEMSIHDATT